MAEPTSDADKIRNKRLAKLGTQNSSSTGEESSSNATATPAHPATTNDTPKTEPVPKSSGNPFSGLGLKEQGTSSDSPQINIKPAAETRSETMAPAKRDSQSVPRSRSQQGARDSPEVWEDRTLGSLFRITLDPGRSKDAQGNQLTVLSGLREELEQDGVALRLNTSNLEQAIVESASSQGSTKALEYLLTCWKRVTKLSRQLRNSNTDQARQNVVQEAKRLCMSYIVFAVTIPDLLAQETPSTNPLTPHLLVDPESDKGLCHEFFQEAISRFGEDDNSIKSVIVGAVEQLSRDLSKMTMNDDYRPYVLGLMSVLRYKPLVDAIAQSPLFLPLDIEAQNIETSTLLGPFFNISPLTQQVASNYFSNPGTRDRGFIANAQNALRMTLQQHQNQLFEIADRFVKSGPESRERILDWFALIMNKNHKRRAMRTDERYVSHDPLMVNVTVCLDRLCEPFMDAKFSKIDRIEVEYLRRSPRIDIKDETKINADQAMSDEFYSHPVGGKNNFISEVFFLTAAAHHYGTETCERKMNDLRREIKYMERDLERFEAGRSEFEGRGPQTLALFDQRVKLVKVKLDEKRSLVMAIEAVLLDETLQARAMSFMRYVIVWIMRLVTGVNYPNEPVELPLPDKQSDVFKHLPEYFIEDVVDHFKFLTNHVPQVISPTQCDELVTFCITFLRNSEYIKNPGVKSGLVVILFHGVWPTRSSQNGVLGNLLNSMPFALNHLFHSLMKFFIECESTGTHTQFYDKFSTRYEIFQVIKCIWGNVHYREQLEEEAKANVEFFVRFVNLLLNDATYLLDETFSAFHKIHDVTKELRERGSALEETEKTQKEEALEEAKNKAKNYMGLTIENMSMLKLFTDALADAFTMPEVVQRLADMLDYNLESMVGPKKDNLKVENPQEYRWDPAGTLSDLFEVYLNLSSKPNFHLAVARDGRSYKPENFAAAANILRKYRPRSKEEMQRWKEMCDAIAKAKESDQEEEEDLGEIPDEFLDPLLAHLMKDPVILPTSKNTVDRSTIRTMLLGEGMDPFNRAPLTMEDVIPDTQLKARIDAFRAEKRGKKKAEAAVGTEVGANGDQTQSMDTSEG